MLLLLPANSLSELMDDATIDLIETDISVVEELNQEAIEANQRKKQAEAAKVLERRQLATRRSRDRADDPVRMYLREMGRVPLLTKEQEITIAKRIEAAEHALIDVILNAPFSIKETLMLAARILEARLKFCNNC